MSNILEGLLLILAKYPLLKFFILGITVIIHGETGIFLFIYLVSKEQIGWSSFFLVAYIAIMLYEVGVYSLGYFLRGTSLGRRLEGRIKNHKKIEKYLHSESAKLIILSRFVIYFSVAVTFLSGWTRVPFKKFIKLRAVAIAAWILIMTGIIFFIVKAFGEIGGNTIFHRIEIAIGFAIVFIFITERIARKVFERNLLKNEEPR